MQIIMTQSNNIKLKFRPSLSLEQIEYILSLRGNDPIIEHEIRKSLEPFKRKAAAGIISPSHISTGRASMADSLGFSSTTTAPDMFTIDELLEVWKTNPAALSPAQTKKVQHHRYINDLMTLEEESAYEKGTA